MIRVLVFTALVQHEQIKDEVVSQDVIPFLIRCATETKYDVIKVQQRALEILWALTFNEQAATILKNDQIFMKHIKTLQLSDEKGVQKAAEGIIWKLEKEAEFMSKNEHEEEVTTETSTAHLEAQPLDRRYKYDVMISYSHTDKGFCYQIQERLVKDKFHVWLDRDNLYGSQMQEMANAIENSEFVFICMSDMYKQSAYCQSEAYYAYERQCCLIPLKMKEKYHPDGWLGLVVSGKTYITFSAKDFDASYQKLMTEISHYRNGRTVSKQDHIADHTVLQHSIEITKYNIPAVNVTTNSNAIERYEKTLIKNLPDNRPEDASRKSDYLIKTYIELWSKEDVQGFLHDMKLDVMIPLCKDMDGPRLHKMYKYCESNNDSMYQALRAELSDLHKNTLPFNVYLRFLDEVKKYVPLSSSTTASAICNTM
ncbi:unnamed protein product [Didymodactylos carnosus]|uniref:TIR domain-containing protein n=1 Tax=Didymodactylos carnosus TaxID=1234261 RepID=A0A815VMZ5_9BILA|nr:unnamed protein product [Didymodactylos carnosus]CAF1535001.1 unnamed protein product [Didymodactylos carnosus]CAF3745453.1 unnamed protein product [Didymodactylos carnosus]CAF4394677.1 unnamed protein product [Didymodactylos carnosus]